MTTEKRDTKLKANYKCVVYNKQIRGGLQSIGLDNNVYYEKKKPELVPNGNGNIIIVF
jgi:hypothetical protein